MANLSQTSIPAIEIQATLGMPAGGPKCLPIDLDFTATTDYSLDYQNMQQRGFLDMLQTLWVDNYPSSQLLTIYVPSTRQTLRIPAGAQGYFTVLSANPIRLEISKAATEAVTCQVTLMNFPVIG